MILRLALIVISNLVSLLLLCLTLRLFTCATQIPELPNHKGYARDDQHTDFDCFQPHTDSPDRAAALLQTLEQVDHPLNALIKAATRHTCAFDFVGIATVETNDVNEVMN